MGMDKNILEQTLSWEEMIEKLLQLFDSDCANIEEIEKVLSSYKSNLKDWKKYAKFDRYKYTRNLVHEGNGKFNLMLLCWNEGNQSTIHDHTNSHCFVKVLDGNLRETKFYWPEEKLDEDGKMVISSQLDAKCNEVCYMSDELGLHRMENPSHSNRTVSLHLYCPPFQSCQIFDERTGTKSKCPMTFWSRYGEKRWAVVDMIRKSNEKKHIEENLANLEAHKVNTNKDVQAA